MIPKRAALVAVAACAGPPAPPAESPPPPPPEEVEAVVEVEAAPTPAADDEPDVETGRDPWTGRRARRLAPGDPPFVVLLVVDTLRADATSLCGSPRPTTPWLAGLASKPGVSATCDAYSPAAWTIPSHASYFTGLHVPDHRMDRAGAVLAPELRTLAEAMAVRGYTTIAVSANPTLGHASGLLRGFDTWTVARGLNSLRGDAAVAAVREALAAAPPDAPVFLFLNLIDAHDPWPAIPDGLGWVPPQAGLALHVHDEEQDAPYHRFVRGELPRADAERLATRVRDVYDHAVHLADRTANRAVGALHDSGRTEAGWRLVLTSDHGEFLGEHGLLRHGCYPWEPVVRVPLVVLDTTRTPPALPSPVSALHVRHLVETGDLGPDRDVAAFTRRRPLDPKRGADMVAVWPSRGEKLVWFEGLWLRYDLAADPGELGREPLGPHAARPLLERWVERHRGHVARDPPTSEARMEALRKLGYVE